MASDKVDDIEQKNEPLLLKPTISDHRQQRRPITTVVLVSCVLLASLIALIFNGHNFITTTTSPARDVTSKVNPGVSPAKAQGVSEKRSGIGSGDGNGSFEWTTTMLAWQRTAYHFQPQKNWMNDPDGPLYHMGWYHLFYQYNPDSAIWGNITWGHAVSRDLIHWLYLPLAMVPDQWFDLNGVWTGSATILPNGEIMMLYTGDTDDAVQVQNLAYPANLSDPLLLHWVKYPNNPLLTPPDGIGSQDFRDPTTAWLGPDGLWRLTIGSKVNTTGISLVYKTSNFTSYELVDHVLHGVPDTGMWECVDFFPVSTTSQTGLDTSYNGSGVKHVLKASMDDNKHDYYAIGTYDSANDTWTPDDPELDVGIGLRVDYGKYYASKTFYDQVKERRILWGWAGETDSEADDLDKGWASIQTIPRVVTFDNKTESNILQWPIEELETLRSSNYTQFQDVLVEPGSVVNLDIGNATQLDISVEFVIDWNALNTTEETITNCSSASTRGALGPFGLLVLTDESLSELTPVYFYISKDSDGIVCNWFCTDKSRSTLASDVDVQVYGGLVPVLDDENYTMRILVDHSVVEVFGQGGRTCITSRIYPTQAIYGDAKLFLFNNATDMNVTASLKVWQLESAAIHPFPLDTQV